MSHPVHGPFFATARRYSLCDDDAEEAMSRAYVAAVQQRDRISDPVGWMHTVVKRRAIDIRSERARSTAWDPAWIEQLDLVEPEVEVDESDPRIPALRDAMLALTADERRALTLFYALPTGVGDGGRARRIATVTGWTASKVYACLSRGRRKLRAELVPEAA